MTIDAISYDTVRMLCTALDDFLSATARHAEELETLRLSYEGQKRNTLAFQAERDECQKRIDRAIQLLEDGTPQIAISALRGLE